MRQKLSVWAFAVPTLIIAGCSSNANEAKMQKAIEKLENRAAPGMVRLLNLSAAPAEIVVKNRSLANEIDSKAGCKFSSVGAGPQKVIVKTASGPINISIKVGSESGTTVILGGDGKTLTEITNESLKPSELGNVHVVAVDPNGKVLTDAVSLEASAGGPKIALSTSKPVGKLEGGEYTLSGPLSEATTFKVDSDKSYTIFLVKHGVKWDAYPLVNTAATKPVLGGMSAA